jgi:hypothetical protein
MDVRYDLWHLAFANLIQDRAPPGFEIQTEVRLTIEPQRADMLLLRRIGAVHEDDKARVMRALWPLLGQVTILEYKSPVRSSFRPGDLIRLWSYGAVYDAAHFEELPSPRDLTLALVLPSITPTLTEEIARMGWTLTALGGGYGRIDGAVYALYVVATNEVSQADHDEFLKLFSRRRPSVGEAARWLTEWMKETEMATTNIREMEGYRAMLLKSMPAEERLEGLDPEERLAGLNRDQQALALSVELLRVLPEAYILSLAPETQEKIRQRLAAADH